jgi:hypothetical protein
MGRMECGVLRAAPYARRLPGGLGKRTPATKSGRKELAGAAAL